MGANVVVTEVDPLKALEAVMDGFDVMPMVEAAKIGDIFVTVTGDIDVIGPRHFKLMKDGAILANSGHFDVEVAVHALREMASETKQILENVEEMKLANGKRILLVSEGRLVNLGAANGHPAEVMDMSFSNQALSLLHLAQEGKNLQANVYPVPQSISAQVAELKLTALGKKIDQLTRAQKKYLTQWAEGT